MRKTLILRVQLDITNVVDDSMNNNTSTEEIFLQNFQIIFQNNNFLNILLVLQQKVQYVIPTINSIINEITKMSVYS